MAIPTKNLLTPFTQLEELKDFYTKAVGFIQTVLAEGWEKKDKFNLELYRIE